MLLVAQSHYRQYLDLVYEWCMLNKSDPTSTIFETLGQIFHLWRTYLAVKQETLAEIVHFVSYLIKDHLYNAYIFVSLQKYTDSSIILLRKALWTLCKRLWRNMSHTCNPPSLLFWLSRFCITSGMPLARLRHEADSAFNSTYFNYSSTYLYGCWA